MDSKAKEEWVQHVKHMLDRAILNRQECWVSFDMKVGFQGYVTKVSETIYAVTRTPSKGNGQYHFSIYDVGLIFDPYVRVEEPTTTAIASGKN